MNNLFYPIWVGGQRFAVPWVYVSEVRRVPSTGGDVTSLYTRHGRILLCDLATWSHTKPSEDQRLALLLILHNQYVGVLIDRIDSVVTFDQPLMDLPPLLHDASVDPSIMGVILIDDVPCLVLDLEALTLMHMPFLPTLP